MSHSRGQSRETSGLSAAKRARDLPHHPVYIAGVAAGHPDSPTSITQRPGIASLGLGKAAPCAFQMADGG